MRGRGSRASDMTECDKRRSLGSCLTIGCVGSNSTSESNLVHGEERIPREPIRAWG